MVPVTRPLLLDCPISRTWMCWFQLFFSVTPLPSLCFALTAWQSTRSSTPTSLLLILSLLMWTSVLFFFCCFWYVSNTEYNRALIPTKITKFRFRFSTPVLNIPVNLVVLHLVTTSPTYLTARLDHRPLDLVESMEEQTTLSSMKALVISLKMSMRMANTLVLAFPQTTTAITPTAVDLCVPCRQ